MSQSMQQYASDGFADKRRYARTKVPVAGRLMLPSGGEYTCDVDDISEGGIALNSQAEGEIGDRVIVYLDNLGRFEGNLVRRFHGGFAIETQLQNNQRARLAERIEWLQSDKSGAERRAFPGRAARRAPTEQESGSGTRLTIENGEEVQCRILDISLTGAHIGIDSRPQVGTHVTVGKTLGRVVRHTDEGVGVEFLSAGNLAN